MIVPIKNIDGKVTGEINLRDDIFGIEPNRAVMHQAYVRQQANARLGNHKAKTRAEVSGTTAKWYRQKGTGRARHGARRAPTFVGGGKAHGPVPHSYAQDMPKKMRRLALRSALSVKAAANEFIVLNDFTFDSPKTAELLRLLTNLELKTSVVILLPEHNEIVEKSARNLSSVKTLRANYLNIRDLLGHDYVIAPESSISIIEGFLG